MTNNNRKPRTLMTIERFELIKRFYKSRPKRELVELTGLCLRSIEKAIDKIDNCEGECQYQNLYAKPGRKKVNKSSLHVEIKSIMANDNTLTQKGCIEKLSNPISKSAISREIKLAGLSRKRLKKRSNSILSNQNAIQRQHFCRIILTKLNRRILFLDESGFNLHTSSNYGYSPINEDAYIYQPSSKGKNISLCAIISVNGIENHKLIDGSYNKEEFCRFLVDCNQKGIFNNNPVLVMDNVAFHHSQEVRIYLDSVNVEYAFLSPYSPDLNPIENIFSWIKSKLDLYRPRSQTREILKNRIVEIIRSAGTLNEYYRSFWSKVNEISNNILE